MWCSALVGESGFIAPSEEGKEVTFDLRRAPFHPDNPLFSTLAKGRALGALFIELATRRRLRVNGQVASMSAERLQLAVEESFPNCPKFIQKRSIEIQTSPQEAPTSEARRGLTLGERERAWIRAADTFFMSTAHPTRGADTSHRGGKPGFVEVVDARTLRLPDYPGNSLFQSFGNLEVDARIGVLFPAFDSGELLHLSGTAHVIWHADDPEGRTGGTGRFLEITVETWVVTPPASQAPRWTFLEASPHNL